MERWRWRFNPLKLWRRSDSKRLYTEKISRPQPSRGRQIHLRISVWNFGHIFEVRVPSENLAELSSKPSAQNRTIYHELFLQGLWWDRGTEANRDIKSSWISSSGSLIKLFHVGLSAAYISIFDTNILMFSMCFWWWRAVSKKIAQRVVTGVGGMDSPSRIKRCKSCLFFEYDKALFTFETSEWTLWW